MSKQEKKWRGLGNQGATDRVNCVLQLLFLIPETREAVLQYTYEVDDGPKINMIMWQLQQLFKELQKTDSSVPAQTQDLLRSFEWGEVEMQQLQEVFGFFMELCSSLEKSTFKGMCTLHINPTCFIKTFRFLSVVCSGFNKLFGHIIAHVLFCRDTSTCPHGRTRDEHYLMQRIPTKGVDSLLDGLKNLWEAEDIGGYQCRACSKKITAVSRGAKVKSIPPLFLIQLDRFSLNFETLQRDKMYHRVEVPMTLNIPRLQETFCPKNDTDLLIQDGIDSIEHWYESAS